MNVRLSKDQKIRVLNSKGVYNIMQQVLLRENKIRRNQEHFWVVGLNTANKIEFIELITLGGVNRASVDPPDVFRMAIYKLAVNIILVHNHPSGTLSPSKADLELTDKMLKIGKLLKVEVMDHLIISETDYTSLEDDGVISELRQSGMFEIVDREKSHLLQWKVDMEKEKAVKANKIDIATKMKAKGYDIDTIKELTGLKKWDIKKL